MTSSLYFIPLYFLSNKQQSNKNIHPTAHTKTLLSKSTMYLYLHDWHFQNSLTVGEMQRKKSIFPFLFFFTLQDTHTKTHTHIQTCPRTNRPGILLKFLLQTLVLYCTVHCVQIYTSIVSV